MPVFLSFEHGLMRAGPTREHVEPAWSAATDRLPGGLRLPVFGRRSLGPVGRLARRLREPLAVNGQRSKAS